MSTAPWLTDEGQFRCFACETAEVANGRNWDPDKWHQGLRESHRILWSRPLPSELSWDFQPKGSWYLKSFVSVADGPEAWRVGSDNFVTKHKKLLPHLAAAIPDTDTDAGHIHAFCTIGGYIIFPKGRAAMRSSGRSVRPWTVNQAKGCDYRIRDRMDLTLEAVRLYFSGVTDRSENPLGDVLDAYGWFFDAFGGGAEGFQAYVDYFFLDPFVTDGRVMPLYGDKLDFDAALPSDPSGYQRYIVAQREAVTSRAHLINEWFARRPAVAFSQG